MYATRLAESGAMSEFTTSITDSGPPLDSIIKRTGALKDRAKPNPNVVEDMTSHISYTIHSILTKNAAPMVQSRKNAKWRHTYDVMMTTSEKTTSVAMSFDSVTS